MPKQLRIGWPQKRQEKYKLGSNPKLKEVADGIWTVTVFNGYVDTMERTIAPEAFIGTEQDATRHALEQWSELANPSVCRRNTAWPLGNRAEEARPEVYPRE